MLDGSSICLCVFVVVVVVVIVVVVVVVIVVVPTISSGRLLLQILDWSDLTKSTNVSFHILHTCFENFHVAQS